MQNITFYLIAFAIKIKRIKNTFSNSQIDYLKLRRDDNHNPKQKDVLGLVIKNTFQIKNSKIFEVSSNKNDSEDIIFYFPGGASIYGPTNLNWNFIAKVVHATSGRAYLIDYPKAPEHNINEINDNIDFIYDCIIGAQTSKKVTLIGDSFGGTLLTLLVQRLAKNNQTLSDKIILISPVMDCSMTNSQIVPIDKVDILLSKKGVLSAKQMCANSIDLKSEIISPLYGCFKNFVPTTIFIAENDITRPDQELFVEKLNKNNVNCTIYFGNKMPHNWVLLPILKEAATAINQIIDIILINENHDKHLSASVYSGSNLANALCFWHV